MATKINQRTMGDFSRPMVEATLPAIVLSPKAREYELKSVHFNLLPSFHGIPNEDALNFMREFCLAIELFPLKGLTEDELKMKFFSHTLKGRAKSWLMLLEPNCLANWDAVCDKFFAKYYPYCKTQELRMQLLEFVQLPDEPFHDTWDRFRSLQQQCPHHHFPLEVLYQTFYNGLEVKFQYKVDNVARGNIANCTAQELRKVFEVLASSSQQKGAKVCKAHTYGTCGGFGHGEKVWQHEENFTYIDRVHVNAMYDFQPQVVNVLPEDYNPVWRQNSTFIWNYDDDDDDDKELIWCGKDDVHELEQVFEDEFSSPPKEENSTCQHVTIELDETIMVEDEDELCYPDLTDEQEGREEYIPVFGFSKLDADFFSFQHSYFIPSASYFNNCSSMTNANFIVDCCFLQDVDEDCLLVGQADVREEDERIRAMEWLRLKKEFG